MAVEKAFDGAHPGWVRSRQARRDAATRALFRGGFVGRCCWVLRQAVFELSSKRAGHGRFTADVASWWINRNADGGLELPPKVVQERLGHFSITITMDV
jgi:hypothetical protein